MSAIYNIQDEPLFDEMAVKLEDMTEQEKEGFMTLLRGFQAGIQVGLRMAEGHQDKTA